MGASDDRDGPPSSKARVELLRVNSIHSPDNPDDELSTRMDLNAEEEPLALTDPELSKELVQEFTEEALRDGMNKEIQQMKDFDVFMEVSADTTENFNDLWHSAMDTTWVLRWEGSSVRARLCVRGYNQIDQDSDLTLASTSVFFIHKVLLTIALAKG